MAQTAASVESGFHLCLPTAQMWETLYEREMHTITTEFLALQTAAFLAEAMLFALFFALPTAQTVLPRKGEHPKKCPDFSV